MMSTDSKNSSDDAVMMCCASCGITAVDDVKLMDCNDGCDLVKYCSDACQENHREQHEEECKRRLVELRDRDLFTMPDESHYGECPICCLPLPIKVRNMFMPCCSKTICLGCDYANKQREFEAGLQRRCPFCREPAAESDEEVNKRIMERIKKNNPAAIRNMAKKRDQEGNYKTAIKYYTKAAKLGDAEAHYNLSINYRNGWGVKKDMKKVIYHAEEAAIGGHPEARNNVGYFEVKNGRFERAKKHFIIASNLGNHYSLCNLKELYVEGHASKEDYADALRAYQAAVEATKSAEREEAEAYYENR